MWRNELKNRVSTIYSRPQTALFISLYNPFESVIIIQSRLDLRNARWNETQNWSFIWTKYKRNRTDLLTCLNTPSIRTRIGTKVRTKVLRAPKFFLFKLYLERQVEWGSREFIFNLLFELSLEGKLERWPIQTKKTINLRWRLEKYDFLPNFSWCFTLVINSICPTYLILLKISSLTIFLGVTRNMS